MKITYLSHLLKSLFTKKKETAVVTQDFNPSTQEAEAGESL